MTTGGTESILMACKAYRDYAREERGITRPNIVVPRTAHSAFDKAAQYLGLHIKYVDVDPKTTQVDVVKMERAINSNTVMVRKFNIDFVVIRRCVINLTYYWVVGRAPNNWNENNECFWSTRYDSQQQWLVIYLSIWFVAGWLGTKFPIRHHG